MTKTIEYRTVDKSTWGPGPWQEEPDKKQWEDESTGLPCLIVRGPVGALCGYVGVGAEHPFYKTDSNDLDCHGGVTFTGLCQSEATPEKGVCHLAEPGEPEHVWWFGFDCAHCEDYTPSLGTIYNGFSGYRNFSYVAEQCKQLAAQLSKIQDKQI